MAKFDGYTIYVGPNDRTPLGPVSAVDIYDDGDLCQLFRAELLKDPQIFRVSLNLPNVMPITCHFARCGQTAGAAAWSLGNGDEAISAYLTGLDKDDERRVELALASRPYPISLHEWHNVLKLKRPILVTFLLTRASRTNPIIALAAPALANSLFSILGVA